MFYNLIVDDDYTLSTNTVVIQLLRSNQICINIDIDDDAIVEDPETFVINWYLDPLLPDVILMNPVTTVIITDNGKTLLCYNNHNYRVCVCVS